MEIKPSLPQIWTSQYSRVVCYVLQYLFEVAFGCFSRLLLSMLILFQ